MTQKERKDFNYKIAVNKSFDAYNRSSSIMLDNYRKKNHAFLLSDGREVIIKFNDDYFIEMMGFNNTELEGFIDPKVLKTKGINISRFILIDQILNGQMSFDIKKNNNRNKVIHDLKYMGLGNVLGFVDLDEDNLICLLSTEEDFYSSVILRKTTNDNVYYIKDIKNLKLEELLKDKTIFIPLIYALINKNGEEISKKVYEASPEVISKSLKRAEMYAYSFDAEVEYPKMNVTCKKLTLDF